MSTVYTAAVKSGVITELEPFVLQLARGMGALIAMRDEPLDAPIPERFEPSQYHSKALAEAVERRDRLTALSDAEAQKAADADYTAWIADKAKAEREWNESRARYLAMIEKVKAWYGAPEGIKEFALEQLQSSLEFDCREPFKHWGEMPTRNGTDWRAEKLQEANRNIDYHAREQAEEEKRVASRNAWLAQLRNSLNMAGATQ